MPEDPEEGIPSEPFELGTAGVVQLIRDDDDGEDGGDDGEPLPGATLPAAEGAGPVTPGSTGPLGAGYDGVFGI